MAIDNREKRQSIIGINMWCGPSPTPNASKDQEWRQQAGYGYSGILADNPVAPSFNVAFAINLNTLIGVVSPMFKKNTAVTGFTFALVSATDGSAITSGTVTGYYTLDGGTQATIAGTPVHEGNGQWSVNLTAAEMNGDIVGLLFAEASAINASFTIKTDTTLVSELNDVSAADVNAQCDISISDASLATAAALTTVDSVVDGIAATLGTPSDFGSGTSTIAANLEDIADDGTATYNRATDSLQAIRDRGDAAYTTATGFSTHSAADVRAEIDANSTQLAAILADTNELQTDDVPGLIAALNNISAADVSAQCDIAISDASLATAASIAALNDISAANVLTQVNAALDTAIAELGVGAPTATPTLRTGLMLLYMALRNRVDVDTTGTDAMKLYNNAGTQIASKTITDDSSDYSEAQMS